jgi:signal transduction histidine kinase
MRRSLTRSLLVRCAFLAVFALFAAVGEHFVRDGVELHYELDDLTDHLLARIEPWEGGFRLRPDEATLSWLGEIPRLQLLLLDPAGQVVFEWNTRSPSSGPDSLLYRLAELTTDGHFQIGDKSSATSRFGYVRSVPSRDGTVFEVVAERGPPAPRDRRYWILHEVRTEYGPFILVSALATVLVVVLTVRRAMRPLAEVSVAARAIVPGHAGSLDRLAVPSEVAPLVDAINGALLRLHEALERERRFTAEVAHTLRTPLAALRARVEGQPEGPQKTALLAAVGRVERLAGQLLFKARLESGALDEAEDFDLAALLQDVAAETAPLFLGEHKTLIVRAPDHRVRCRGSRAAVEQALLNLLDNASKAAPPGSEVEVRLAADGTLLVRDRGPGFTDGETAQLFAPFRRGRTSRWQGAGLGLTIVAEAVRRHGGELIVRNRKGGGAEIGFRLPIESAAPAARKVAA